MTAAMSPFAAKVAPSPTDWARTVAIVGAGPVGLAAGAHVLERGLVPAIFEAGSMVGHAVTAWGHVPMFSPWEYNIDKASARLLAETGWQVPALQTYPTGADLVAHYLAPLATETALAPYITTGAEVVAIARAGCDKVKSAGRDKLPFEVRVRTAAGVHAIQAHAVIDCSGTWGGANPAGANGLAAIGEADHAARIAYAMPDVLGRARQRYAGKTVAVLGAGHSAIGTLGDLARLATEAPGTEIIWLLRGLSPEKAFGGGANDKLAARGQLGVGFAQHVAAGAFRIETGFAVDRISDVGGRLRIASGSGCCARHVEVDELIVATGFRPDFSFTRELRLSLDPALECPPALAPLIDPNEHSCGTVRPHGALELGHPEAGFYIAGMKSYGRAPTFLALTGYEQVRSIVAEIAGDHEAARRVELELPETGVCSAVPGGGEAVSGCCAPAPVPVAASCCNASSNRQPALAGG